MALIEEVVKGGESWLQLSIDRTSKGLEIWAKADPRVEEFMKSSSDEGRVDALSAFGRTWAALDPENDIAVYRLEQTYAGPRYKMNAVCGALHGKNAEVNLSFLQFIGIGSPEGVKFLIAGPYSRDFAKKFAKDIINGAYEFFKDYVVPVHISLRISSQEL